MSQKKRKTEPTGCNGLLIALSISLLALLVVIGWVIADGKKNMEEGLESNTESNTENKVTIPTYKPTQSQTETQTQAETETQTETQQPTESETQTQVPSETQTQVPTVDNNKYIYLTFDDGPSPMTLKILDILDRYNVKATFFVVEPEEECRYILKEIVNRGHQIGVHCVYHDYRQIYADMNSFIADVDGIRQIVYNETGVMPTMYRFPGGSNSQIGNVDRKDAVAYLKSQNIEYYDWNVSGDDSVTYGTTSEQITDSVFKDAGRYQHSFVLLHDTYGKDATVEALPGIIERMLNEGYVIKRIEKDTPPVHFRLQ